MTARNVSASLSSNARSKNGWTPSAASKRKSPDVKLIRSIGAGLIVLPCRLLLMAGCRQSAPSRQ